MKKIAMIALVATAGVFVGCEKKPAAPTTPAQPANPAPATTGTAPAAPAAPANTPAPAPAN